MKKIWVTALDKDAQSVQKILGTIRQYGLDGNGHFWQDDIKNLAWLGPKEALADRETSLWVILCSLKSLESESVRYGLSLLAITVQAVRGIGFPILFAVTDGALEIDKLPTPLRGADSIAFSSPSLGAKIVAKANTPVPKISTDYRIDIHANPNYGIWFEVGPAGTAVWKGALIGVSGGDINFHGVGAAGTLPEKSVLEYPMEGLKLQLGEKDYSAWAVQNTIDAGHSYYVRIHDMPSGIVFGPYAPDDEASVSVISLR
ncbi:hypothetical protein LLG96_00645 [bacterium]|nr:hypothetical protein [bacterium]